MANQKQIRGKLHNNSNLQKKKSYSILEKNNWLVLPIFLVIAIVPLLMRLKSYTTLLSNYAWFSEANRYDDFFLLYKKDFFLLLIFIMITILIVKAFMDKSFIRYEVLFIPLSVYALLILLSSIFSKYRNYSFHGIHEQFESVYVVLGYCILVYYTYLCVKSERDIRNIVKGLIFCILVFGIIGFTQLIDHDIFSTEFGKWLIIPGEARASIGDLVFNFRGMAYLTLYNPNYVSVYVSMIAPIILSLLLFEKKEWKKTTLYIIAFASLMLCLYAAKTSAGYLSLGFGLLILFILMWRYLIKYKKLVIPLAGVVLLAVIGLVVVKQDAIVTKVKNFLQTEQVTFSLKEIQTNDNDVQVFYNDHIMKVQFTVDELKNAVCVITDEDGQPINVEYHSDGTANVLDERFPGFVVGPCYYDEKLSFFIKIDGNDWFFTNQSEDGTYYYLNQYGRFDKIVPAPTALFTNYQNLFNRRGHIWSKTIPLLKKYIILGSGADTFALVYPQSDYVSQTNVGLGKQLVTKPHSLYLQIAVQYGVLALIAFLVFYGMYFVSSIKLYIKGIFNSYFAQIGLGIMVGTLSYMISGLTNDSCITVAPIFWALVGLGIVVNTKAKPMVEKELSKIGAERSKS